MAFAKCISGNGIYNGAVTVAPRDVASGEPYFVLTDRARDNPGPSGGTLDVIDSRYRIGASGGWERPGSDFA